VLDAQSAGTHIQATFGVLARHLHRSAYTPHDHLRMLQVRVGFKGGEHLWVEDVLNIGVDPR
jgi:hypothetical protein